MHPDQVLTNRGAQAGDVLILTKGLGVGILSAAFKQGRLDAAGYAALIASTTRLNTLGAKLAGRSGVHAVTDVTGFGLLGHALEMARGAGAHIELTATPPVLPGVEGLLAEGVHTGASIRNWVSYGNQVEGVGEGALRDLLTDPQTSGGLLIAVAGDQTEALLSFAQAGGFEASLVGGVVAGKPGVTVLGA